MKEIKMPSLSPTMEEGKIVRWIKKEGDEIKRGDIIGEIETDKAVMEYESEEEGKIGKIIRGEGEEVKVGEVIGLILEEGDKEEEIDRYEVKREEEKKEEIAKESRKEDSSYVNNNINNNTNNNNTISVSSNRIFISPLARVIASQHNVDISKVTGTGPYGRIVKSDIMSYIEMGSSYQNNTTSTGIYINNSSSILGESAYHDIENSSMRKTIAKRLLQSKTTVPHYYLTIECLVDELIKARTIINKSSKDKYKISINDFIIKALALSMKDVPEANSYWNEGFTRQFSRQDVSVAVAVPNGLITPIIKDAANKGLIEISNEMKSLVNKAKEGTLKLNEIQGGGFSLSNLGMFGIEEFAAIINPPQSGILAVGAVIKKPVVINNEITIGSMLKLTLSADHRVLDGATGAIFLNKIKSYLENPTSMLL